LHDRIQSLTDADPGPQFFFNEDGTTPYERHEPMDFMPNGISNDRLCFECQMKKIARRDDLEEITGLLPDWSRQRFRILCPCKDDSRYIWVRSSNVISLGELFLHLSDTYDCAAIYYLYQHFAIVAVKRWKGKKRHELPDDGRQALPAQPSLTGMAAAGLSGASLQQKQPWKHILVTDYCKMTNGYAVVPPQGSPAWKDFYQKAIRHAQALILQDLNPPFLENAFSGHPSSKHTLSAYSRATFLRWDEAASTYAFGDDIIAGFRETIARYKFEFAGILGRPLYVCGAPKPISDSSGDLPQEVPFCMNVASMSPLLVFKDERQLWRCALCAKAGVLATSSRRMLRLYPLVQTHAQGTTPMRSKHVIVAVEPPPDEFDWKQAAFSKGDGIPSRPIRHLQTAPWEFTGDESRAIWLSSTSYV
jgi:hypothetical protein